MRMKSLDLVFKALADESRRRLLDRLRNRNGQTLGALCSGHDMTRQALSKHLSILEQANLVVTVLRFVAMRGWVFARRPRAPGAPGTRPAPEVS
jgi:DNA-binding transcriptional ArsR family regulator